MSATNTIDRMALNNTAFVAMLLEGIGGDLMPAARRVELIQEYGEGAAEQVAAVLMRHVNAWHDGTPAREYIPLLCKILGSVGGDIARDTLLTLVGPQYASTMIQQYACEGLRLLNAPEMIPELMLAALSPRSSNRPELAGILAKYPAAREALLAVIVENIPKSHLMPAAAKLLYAILALAVRKDLDDKAVLVLLRVLQESTNESARSEAAGAVTRIIPRNFEPGKCDELLAIVRETMQHSAVSDGGAGVRGVAADALRKLEAWNSNLK